jgi:aminoglycoside 6'-N-acetyltransferase
MTHGEPHEAGGPPASLAGARVTLRALEDADVARLVEIVNEPEIREWWWGYDEARMRTEVFADNVTPFAIELEGALIGLIMYAEEPDPCYRYASIDLTLDSAHLGRGLGTDALRTLAQYLFEVRGHHRITIDPAVSNARAIAAYSKVGFRPVGVMREYELTASGQWRDALLMDLLRGELT